MIRTVDRVSLSYSCPPSIWPLKKIFDRWLPNFLGKACRMQEDQCQVVIVSAVSLVCYAGIMERRVALGCDVIRVGRSRRADNGFNEHLRGRGRGQGLGDKRGSKRMAQAHSATLRLRRDPAILISRLGPRLLDRLVVQQGLSVS